MADYPYDGQLIADPVTFQRAQNAQISVYDANDVNNTTKLALKDASGLALPNPLTSSADAFTVPFYAPSQDIKLVGAGLTVFVSSAKGMRDAAAAAASAAQEAASEAVTAAGDRVTTAAVTAGKLILTKATGEQIDAGAVIGPQGAKGDKGLDGANVLPTAEAIAQAVTTDGPAKTALTATILDQVETAVPSAVAFAVPPAVAAEVGAAVPPAVSAALASDTTVADAAAEAVTTEIQGRELVEGSYADVTGISVSIQDAAGNRTFLEANDSTGGPSSFSLALLKAGLDTLAPAPELPDVGDYKALALAAANAGVDRALTIYCIGPSTVEGAGIVDPADRYVDRLGARLHAMLGIPGTYKVRFWPAFYESSSMASAQPVRSGTATKVVNTLWLGPGGRSVALGTAGAVQWTVNARQVRVHYSRTTDAGTPSYKIDGGAAVPFAASWNGAELCGQVSPWIDLGSAGAHTFAVTSEGAGQGTVAGIEVRDATTDAADIGIHIIDAARGGYDINNYVEGQMTRQLDSMRPFKPDVIWFGDTGKNRYGGQSDAPDVVAANLGIAIDRYRNAASTEKGWTVSVICTGSFGRGVTTVTKGTWPAYIDAMKKVVKSKGASWLDVSTRLPASQGDLVTFTDTYGVYADTVHFNAIGQRWYGSLAAAYMKDLVA